MLFKSLNFEEQVMPASARILGAAVGPHHFAAVVVLLLIATIPASALEFDQAIESCARAPAWQTDGHGMHACRRWRHRACREGPRPRSGLRAQSAMAASRGRADLFDPAKVSARKPEEAAADARRPAGRPRESSGCATAQDSITAILSTSRSPTRDG